MRTNKREHREVYYEVRVKYRNHRIYATYSPVMKLTTIEKAKQFLQQLIEKYDYIKKNIESATFIECEHVTIYRDIETMELNNE